MKNRCYNKNDESYKNYGARGITVCDEWKDDFSSFWSWAYSHGYDDTAEKGECTIDRIDNNKGYSPDNCRFVSMKDQANNKRSNRVIDVNGTSMTIAQYSEMTGLPYDLVRNRINKGWDIDKIENTPVDANVHKITNSKNETHTITEWSEIVGINRDVIRDRIFKRNWNVDDALYTPIFSTSTTITYNGDTFNLTQWAYAMGIGIGKDGSSTISHRLTAEWDIKRALTTPRNNKSSTNAVYFVDSKTNTPISQQDMISRNTGIENWIYYDGRIIDPAKCCSLNYNGPSYPIQAVTFGNISYTNNIINNIIAPNNVYTPEDAYYNSIYGYGPQWG